MLVLSLGLLDLDRGLLFAGDGQRSLTPTEVAVLRYLWRVSDLAEAAAMGGRVDETHALLTSVGAASPKIRAQVETRLAGVLHGLGRLDEALAAVDRAWDLRGHAEGRGAALWRRHHIEMDLGIPQGIATGEQAAALIGLVDPRALPPEDDAGDEVRGLLDVAAGRDPGEVRERSALVRLAAARVG